MSLNARQLGLGAQLVSPNIAKAALPVVSVLSIAVFLFEGPILFAPAVWARWQLIVISYAVLLALVFGMNLPVFDIPFLTTMKFFLPSFGGGLVVFYLIFHGFKYGVIFPSADFFSTFALQWFVITYVEEAFFRGLIADKYGVIPSALSFSLFHAAAYVIQGLPIGAFIVAFVMGIAFAFIYLNTKEQASIAIPWGLHLAWNTALLFF